MPGMDAPQAPGFKRPLELSDLQKRSHSLFKIFQKKEGSSFSITHPVALKKTEDRDCFPYWLNNVKRYLKFVIYDYLLNTD